MQFLEAQIKERDGATVGTQRVVKNLELHHVAGVTDMRSQLLRCDTAIARLATDLKAVFDSIQAVAQRQHQQNAQITEKLHQLESKVSDAALLLCYFLFSSSLAFFVNVLFVFFFCFNLWLFQSCLGAARVKLQ